MEIIGSGRVAGRLVIKALYILHIGICTSLEYVIYEPCVVTYFLYEREISTRYPVQTPTQACYHLAAAIAANNLIEIEAMTCPKQAIARVNMWAV